MVEEIDVRGMAKELAKHNPEYARMLNIAKDMNKMHPFPARFNTEMLSLFFYPMREAILARIPVIATESRLLIVEVAVNEFGVFRAGIRSFQRKVGVDAR